MIPIILRITLIFMEVIILDILASTFFPVRKKTKLPLRIGRMLVMTGSIAANILLFPGIMPLRLLVNVLAAFLYITLFYRAAAFEAVSILMFYFSIIVSGDFLGPLLFSLILPVSTEYPYGIYFAEKLAEIGTAALAHKIWRKKNTAQIRPKSIRVLLLSAGISVWTAMFSSKMAFELQNASREMIFLICGILGMNIFSFLNLLSAMGMELERDSLKETARSTRMQLEIYKSKQALYMEQGKRLHEYKNQLLTISQMLETEKTAQVQEYIGSLTGRMIKELDHINTNHPAANAVLNIKKQEASEKNIKMNFLCSDLKNIILKDEEIIILLGNLLDNAIEAAEKQPQGRMIQVKIEQGEKQLVITVKNTGGEPFLKENGRIISSKSNKEEHGYGITAMESIVKKYDGTFAIKKDGDYVKATAVIPNP